MESRIPKFSLTLPLQSFRPQIPVVPLVLPPPPRSLKRKQPPSLNPLQNSLSPLFGPTVKRHAPALNPITLSPLPPPRTGRATSPLHLSAAPAPSAIPSPFQSFTMGAPTAVPELSLEGSGFGGLGRPTERMFDFGGSQGGADTLLSSLKHSRKPGALSLDGKEDMTNPWFDASPGMFSGDPLALKESDEEAAEDESLMPGDALVGCCFGHVLGDTAHLDVRERGESAVLEPYEFEDTELKVIRRRGAHSLGFLTGSVAAVLRPLMMMRKIRVRAQVRCSFFKGEKEVPRAVGEKDPSTKRVLQVAVNIFGRPGNHAEVVEQLQRHTDVLFHAGDDFRRKQIARRSPPAPGVSRPSHPTAPVSSPTEVSQMLGDLEQLFAKHMVDFDSLPTAEPTFIRTNMHHYQKQALHWLIQREKGDANEALFFWETREVKGRTMFYNKFTNEYVKERPKPMCGGILADEMGLGKTLQFIALIATNSGKRALEQGEKKVRKKTRKVAASRPAPKQREDVAEKRDKLAEWMLRKEEASSEESESESSDSEDSKNDMIALYDQSSFGTKLDTRRRQERSQHVKVRRLEERMERKLAEDLRGESGEEEEEEEEDSGDEGPATLSERPTLIVCPLSVLSIWRDQIDMHMKRHHLSVYTYHGSNRTKERDKFLEHDVILTTYNIVSHEWDPEFSAADKAERQETPPPDASQFLGLPTLMSISPQLKGLPPPRRVIGESQKKQQQRRKRFEASGGRSPLFSMRWLRIILDESHFIKDSKTRTSRACTALIGDRRWCCTGTPIQNKIDDAFALLRFLGLSPFTHHRVWTRVVTSPLKSRNEEMQKKGLEFLQTLIASICLRRTKNDSIQGKPIFTLPPKRQTLKVLPLSEEERASYDALALRSKKEFGSLLRSGMVMSQYAHILEILLRLRQFCDHYALVPKQWMDSYGAGQVGVSGKWGKGEGREKTKRLLEAVTEDPSIFDQECVVCDKSAVEPVVASCFHVFCRKCIEPLVVAARAVQASMDGQPMQPWLSPRHAQCPLCSVKVDPDVLITPDMADEYQHQPEPTRESLNEKMLRLQKHPPSTKLRAVFRELAKARKQKAKVVIFSQWTSMLDLLQAGLMKQGCNIARLDGTMSDRQRRKAIRSFREDESVYVFLISLKAGGVGLNLTAGNHVFVLDPWWNPSTEDQAIDRVHRLGQEKEVIVTRFIMKDTVEEKIIQLQQHKRELVHSAFMLVNKGRSQQQKRKRERLKELRSLFS